MQYDQPRSLWDRQSIMYTLATLLGRKWLTRKLPKLAWPATPKSSKQTTGRARFHPSRAALPADKKLPRAPQKLTNEAVTHLGFNLHASVTLRADDDRGRERLCRLHCRAFVFFPMAVSRIA